MISVLFDTEAMTRVRFGISPLFETIASVSALDDAEPNGLHSAWAEAARPRARGIDLGALRALWHAEGYAPDFINPPPGDPVAGFEDELEVMVATPAQQIREEVRRCYGELPVPAELQPFVSRPRAAVHELAEQLRSYWRRTLSEHWPRISSLLEHDVLYRARQMADGGTQRLFSDLDPTVTWDGKALQIDKHCEMAGTLELDERGLLLMPSVFAWPRVMIVSEPPWQPTLIYPARGVGMLWGPERPAAPDALERLLGRNRAAILAALDRPRSTTELARVVGISNGGVSQHLTVLRSAGLIRGRRAQRAVLYLRSSDGDALVQTAAGSA
jgi:DNA-binding transcriptional ArsR family regulator